MLSKSKLKCLNCIHRDSITCSEDVCSQPAQNVQNETRSANRNQLCNPVDCLFQRGLYKKITDMRTATSRIYLLPACKLETVELHLSLVSSNKLKLLYRELTISSAPSVGWLLPEWDQLSTRLVVGKWSLYSRGNIQLHSLLTNKKNPTFQTVGFCFAHGCLKRPSGNTSKLFLLSLRH